jgi:hypothetical protein
MGRVYDEHIVTFDGLASFILRNENFVQLLPRTDADTIDLAGRGDRMGHTEKLHAPEFSE